MAWNDTITALNHVLAKLYPTIDASMRIVNEAGIPPEYIAFQPRAIDNWFNILLEADNRHRIMAVVSAALRQYPDNPILIQAAKGDSIRLEGPPVRDDNWKTNLSSDTFEAIMGRQSTLLPISFLEVGLARSRAVARVVLPNGTGSGFLTSDNIFVTNHHVIDSELKASEALIQFNYEQDPKGLDLKPVQFRLEPKRGFKTSPNDDWTLVRVAGDANSDWGAIELKPVEIKAQDVVNIIQHPAGGPKQIALYHNVVTYRDDNRIQYLTDTLPGSSGSPVFDSHWNAVALHHSGGWILEPGTKDAVYRNEGINIQLVLKGLEKSGLAKPTKSVKRTTSNVQTVKKAAKKRSSQTSRKRK